MPSHFIWYELITPDLDAAIAFYGKVIGWNVVKSDAPGKDYRRIEAHGQPVGGMMATPDMASEMPAAWFGYVNVADVDAEVAAFTEAGGKVLWPANDIPGIGRMAMVADPQGAALYVMTPTGDGESQAYKPGADGHGGWHEYHATDWEAAFAFYSGRFGWVKDQAMDMGAMGTYLTFKAGDVLTGGLMNNPLPQQAWLYYFMTGDIDAASERITTAGGTIQLPPMHVPGDMWALVACDPQGAMFGLLGSRAAS